MQITVSLQSVITAAAFVGAVIALVAYFSKVVRWVDKQSKQDEAIHQLRQHHEEDMKIIKEEQAIIVHGVLACLKGLREQGCNGPVKEGIAEIEDYLNQKAHQ
jgi:hypothetical protein